MLKLPARNIQGVWMKLIVAGVVTIPSCPCVLGPEAWAEYQGHLFPFINVSHSGPLLWALRWMSGCLEQEQGRGGGLAVCDGRGAEVALRRPVCFQRSIMKKKVYSLNRRWCHRHCCHCVRGQWSAHLTRDPGLWWPLRPVPSVVALIIILVVVSSPKKKHLSVQFSDSSS